jgi:hypothetical protein
MDEPMLTVTRELTAEEARRWENAVVIIPVVKMDTPRGLWGAVCQHPDHLDDPEWGIDQYGLSWGWRSGPTSAGGVAVALEQHWEAKHGG